MGPNRVRMTADGDPPSPSHFTRQRESYVSAENALAFNRIQVILAEKRTYLAYLRTGIAVIALPLTVCSFLIAVSSHYQVPDVLGLLIPVLIICAGLFILGVNLIWKALTHLKSARDQLARCKADSLELGLEVD